jgi:NAD(P)H-hydrate epimerase
MQCRFQSDTGAIEQEKTVNREPFPIINLDPAPESAVSVADMREADRRTIENGTPSLELMRRAAQGVFDAYGDWSGKAVLILCGGGNNGGDGYALACILARHGHPCRMVKLSEKLTEESAYYAELAAGLGVPMEPYAPGAFAGCDTVVDCLLGTGFQGSLREPWRSAVEEINASGARVISVDINSGMNGDTGEAETAVRSDLTVTIGFVKRGLVTENAGRYMKRLVVVDIGIVLARQEDKLCASGETEPPSGTIVCTPWLERTPIDVRSASEQELEQA